MSESLPSIGGKARASNLTPESRRKIARQAASARWHRNVPKAVADGILEIGNLRISCSVIEKEVDGEKAGLRVLSEREFTKSLGGKRGGSHWRRKAKGDGAN